MDCTSGNRMISMVAHKLNGLRKWRWLKGELELANCLNAPLCRYNNHAGLNSRRRKLLFLALAERSGQFNGCEFCSLVPDPRKFAKDATFARGFGKPQPCRLEGGHHCVGLLSTRS
eukprot:1159824-Pelagomonas_calceolata.AAC.3